METGQQNNPQAKNTEKQNKAPGYCLLIFSMSIVILIFASLLCTFGMVIPAVALITNETIRIPANSTGSYRVDLADYGTVQVIIRGIGIAGNGRNVDAFYYFEPDSSGEIIATTHSGMLMIDDIPASNYFRLYSTNNQGLTYAENHIYRSEFSLLNTDVYDPHLTFRLTGTLQEGEFIITVQQSIVMKLID